VIWLHYKNNSIDYFKKYFIYTLTFKYMLIKVKIPDSAAGALVLD
jgi:hypothetical protein